MTIPIQSINRLILRVRFISLIVSINYFSLRCDKRKQSELLDIIIIYSHQETRTSNDIISMQALHKLKLKLIQNAHVYKYSGECNK